MPSGTSGFKGGLSLSGWFLAILAIISITALIVMPNLEKASTANTRIERFQSAFGIWLPLNSKTGASPLSEEQRQILRPLVRERIAELCAREETDSADPVDVQRRLIDTVRDQNACSRAREVAEQEGIVFTCPLPPTGTLRPISDWHPTAEDLDKAPAPR